MPVSTVVKTKQGSFISTVPMEVVKTLGFNAGTKLNWSVKRGKIVIEGA